MKHTWKLIAFWRPRDESAMEIAQRLERFMELASATCPNLSRWFKQVNSSKSKKPKTPINEYDLPTLEKMVNNNRFDDDEGNPMDCGGYIFGLWNGQPSESIASMLMAAGMKKSSNGHEYMSNKISFNLRPDLAAHGLGTDDALERFLETIIIAWDPDWAVLFRSESPAIRDRDRSAPYLDKLAWVGPARLTEASKLAGEGITVEVLGGGMLYTRLNPPEIP